MFTRDQKTHLETKATTSEYGCKDLGVTMHMFVDICRLHALHICEDVDKRANDTSGSKATTGAYACKYLCVYVLTQAKHIYVSIEPLLCT